MPQKFDARKILEKRKEADDFFWEIVRNLPAQEIYRIRRGQVAREERAKSLKIDTACRAHEQYQRFSR